MQALWHWLLVLIVAASVVGCEKPVHHTTGVPGRPRSPNPWSGD